MITILRNDAGEIAVVNSMAGFARLMPYAVIASRFVGAAVAWRLPLVSSDAGWTAAVRMLIASLGAVYPCPASLRPGIVDSAGKVLHGPTGTAALGRLAGVPGITVMSHMLG